MRQPPLSSTVERRILVNYRVDPRAAADLLPAPLRPQLVRGYAVAGICLLRLGDVRPDWLPKAVGLRSENAAHRIAVEWDGPHGVETGVYIPRRDTASRLNTLGRRAPVSRRAPARRFPGTRDARRTACRLHHARPHHPRGRRRHRSRPPERQRAVLRPARRIGLLPLRIQGILRHRSRPPPRRHAPADRRVESLGLPGTHSASTFFDDPVRFPPGTATLDCALLMRNLPARWQPLPRLTAGSSIPHFAVEAQTTQGHSAPI